MSVHAARTSVRAHAAAAPRAEAIERKLRGFRPEVQTRVRSMAERHVWIADLAVSFPALLFALAFPRRGVDGARAIELAQNGAPLSAIAAAAGVAMWLREASPQAFTRAVPLLPDTTEFRRRIANHFPKRWADAPAWLDHIAEAALWANDDVALWAAREAPPKQKQRDRKRRRTQAAQVPRVWFWAWFSARPETDAGAAIPSRWNSEMKWEAASNHAYRWSDALRTSLWLGANTVADPWLTAGEADGYTFTPLLSATDLADESAAMTHCVGTYGERLVYNEGRVFSVRRDGARVATLYVRGGYRSPYPHIEELSGVRNQAVSNEVWIAALRWMLSQASLDAEPKRFEQSYKSTYNVAAWRALFRPYWLAKRRFPNWLPLTPKEEEYYLF
jgi:hypothetical protein